MRKNDHNATHRKIQTDRDHSLRQLELLLDDLSEIPINDGEEIESDFYCWEKGTFNFEIWHWFDEKLSDGWVNG
ncbi:MAG: hypothetical protein ABIR50_05055 [Ginsengibacter sp.]